MATPSKRHVNITSVAVNTGNASVTITGVQRAETATGASTIVHSGDGDAYPTCIVQDFAAPKVTIEHRDLSAAHSLPPGTRGALTFVRPDAKNGVTANSGGFTTTLNPAIVQDTPEDGAHRQYASGRLIFEGESTNGALNPLSFSAL